MILFIVFTGSLVLGTLLGYQIGADKRVMLQLEVKHFRESRDRALADVSFWQKRYEEREKPAPEK